MMTFLHRPLFILALALPPLGAQPTRLELGKTVEAELGAGQTHQYTVRLSEGQFMRVVVSRPGFATVMRFSAVAGAEKLLELHWPAAAQRPEPLCWIARTAGEYRVELSASEQGGGAAKYTITLMELRGAAAADSQHLQIQQLFETARVLTQMQEFRRAITEYERALALARQLGQREREAEALNALGNSHGRLGEREKAAGFFAQAAVIFRELKNPAAEVTALNNLGNAYRILSHYEKAIGSHQQALAVSRESKDRRGESNTLSLLGDAHMRLNQNEKAIGYQEQALTIRRELKHLPGEAGSLASLGSAYVGLKQYAKAIAYYEKALAIHRELKERFGEGGNLHNLGYAYFELGEYQKSIAYSEQALAIHREVKNRRGEGNALTNLGHASAGLGRYEQSKDYCQQALVIAREIKDRENLIEIFTRLMDVWKSTGNPRFAIFYGKQAINTVQSMRSDIQGLGGDIQQSFVKGNEDSYHQLASLLIGQGHAE